MQPTLKQAWSNLADYYLKCLEIEQMQTLGVQHQQNHALLRYLTDTLISNGAERAEISHASDLREVRQFLARKAQQEGQTLYYAYPLVVQAGVKIPICYAAVEVTANPNGDVILARQDRPLVNRRFLRESSDLTESEVADFGRQIGATTDQLAALFPNGAFMSCGMLFRASPDRMTASLQWELKWLKNQSTLSPPLAAYLQEEPPAARSTDAPSVTVVRSNPAQDKVLRNRFSTLQVVAGPPGTGKTQTIINLIASTVCDQQTVLFISKNNTAVDNVYEAFVEQELFPGILRLGNQEAKKRAVERVRAVMEQLQEGMPQPEAQAALDAQGIALHRETARLEEELNEVSTLSATVQEMALLLRRVDGALQERGLYRYATDLAQQITLENAAQFQPPQLVGLRRLVARTAPWSEPPKGFWERLLAHLGITRWQQRVRFERALQALALPACCTVAGEDLQQRLDNLLRLDAVYPFLLATARHVKATSDLAAKRSRELIRGELEQVHQAKIEHGRRQLRRHWAEMVNAAQGQLSELAELCALFERMTEGAVETKERQKWRDGYSKLLRIFPVICSTNLSLAGAAPNERNLFHLVVLDEASQSDIASFLPALYRAQRACVVGDDKQLRHISNLGIEEDERQMALAKVSPTDTPSYHRHSAFDRAMAVAGRTAFTLLDRHYRCVPEIIGFCNTHFYEGKLKIERSDERVVPLPGGLPARGFLFDDIAAGRADYRAIAASRSASNRLEAERVIGLVQTYIAAGLTDIGVVTPFRGQRGLLTALLAQARQAEGQPAIQAALAHVEIGTIHTFQGGQHGPVTT
jgi:DNA polymerase III delta prime subunit